MAKYFALVFAIGLVGLASSQYSPVLRLYSSTNCGGVESIFINNFVPDLAQIGFDNRAHSVSIRGTWVFYDTRNFNTAGDALMEYIFRASETCVNFDDIGGYASSVKFVGHSTDYREDAITFYAAVDFQSDEEYVNFDIPSSSLYQRTASFIITGSSSWTIYDTIDYRGNAVCLQLEPSPFYEPAFVQNTVLLDPTVPHGTIASVRRGCFTNNIRSLKRGSAVAHEMGASAPQKV